MLDVSTQRGDLQTVCNRLKGVDVGVNVPTVIMTSCRERRNYLKYVVQNDLPILRTTLQNSLKRTSVETQKLSEFSRPHRQGLRSVEYDPDSSNDITRFR